MKDIDSYIKVKYNVNINEEQIYVVTNNKATLLTKENAKKMSRVLRGFKGKKINNSTYIYKDYDKIIDAFFGNKTTKKVNRNKSKKVILGIIGGSIVTLLVSGVFTHFKNKKTEENSISQGIVYEDDSIGVPLKQNPYIDVDVAISNIEGDDNNFDINVSVDSQAEEVEETKEEVSYDVNIHEFNYNFSGDFDYQTVANSKQYRHLYNKYGNMYGVDPILLLLIGAQESAGIHSTKTSGLATGVMQVEDWWLNKSFEVYNFEIGDYEKITVDPNKVTNLEDNIKYGAALLRYCVDYSEKKVKKGYITENDFLPFIIQTYNMGETNMNKILDYSGYWFDNRSYIGAGDSKYIEHVFCEAPNDTVYWFKTKDGKEYSARMENMSDWIYSNAPSGYSL